MRGIEEGIMTGGVIVRHLMLPGLLKDTKAVIRYLYETYGDSIYISIMNQYTPMPFVENIPEFRRAVRQRKALSPNFRVRVWNKNRSLKNL